MFIAESAARTVNVRTPDFLGVPEITPEALRLKPAGSEPDARVQVTEPDAPLAVSVAMYECPTTPDRSDMVVIFNTEADETTMVVDMVTTRMALHESLAAMVAVNDPAALGVPAIVPES